MEKKRTAVVISGGGSMGAFAVGAIRYIFRQYRDSGWFSIVGGSSTGALMAPFVALLGAASSDIAAKAMALLIGQYSAVTTGDILERQSLFEFIKRQDCLYRSTPLRKRLNGILDRELFELLTGEDMPYCYVVYTNYQKGTLEVASPRDPGMSRERFIDAMMASASVPVVMEPTIIDGEDCYDGGVRDVLPVTRAIDLGAETILPIMLSPDTVRASTDRFRRLDKVLFRTLTIMLDETCRNDLQMANLVNMASRVRQDVLQALAFRPRLRGKIQAVFERDEYKALFRGEKHLVRIIEGLHPDEELTANALRFEPSEMRHWIELGEEKAGRVLTEDPF